MCLVSHMEVIQLLGSKHVLCWLKPLHTWYINAYSGKGHVYPHRGALVLFASPSRQSHWCQLGRSRGLDTATDPNMKSMWVWFAKLTLSALGAVHPHRCHIASSGCVRASAASQLTSIGLPARGCIQTYVHPHGGKHGHCKCYAFKVPCTQA